MANNPVSLVSLQASFDASNPILNDLNSTANFQVVLLEGQDGLSELFDYQVEARVSFNWFTENWSKPSKNYPSKNAESELAKASMGILISKEVGGQSYTRVIHGEIWDLSALVDAQSTCTLRFRLRPALARLELAKSTRAWTGKSAMDVLKELVQFVYQKFEIPEIKSPGNYNEAVVRPLVMQYQETDLSFFLRLCSQHGIAFYTTKYTTSKDGKEQFWHGIALTNNTSTISDIGPDSAVVFNRDPNNPEDMCLRTWRRQTRKPENPIEIRDSSYRKYDSQLQVSETPGVGSWQEDSASTSNYLDTQKGDVSISNLEEMEKRTRSALIAARDAQNLVVESESNCFHLVPGADFEVPDQANFPGNTNLFELSSAKKPCRVLRQRLKFFQDKRGGQLDCTLQIIPADKHHLPWRPLPKPRISGVLTARVVGGDENTPRLANENVSADANSGLGRVMIRLHCDRVANPTQVDSKDENDKPKKVDLIDVKAKADLPMDGYWARVTQSWAGPKYGAMFWPRVGNEVLVAFENGDPDRPVVVGSLYNSLNETPYTLPAASHILGWKTKCQGDTDGTKFNVLILGDEEKDAGVVIRSSGDIYVANKGERNILGPGSFEVK